VIEGARLIDGTGRPPIEDAVIVIGDDKIQQVFKKGERGYPQDARIIRAEGKAVIPALLDIDTHIGQQGLEAAAQALSNYLYFGVVNISDTGVTLIHGEGLKKLEGEASLSRREYSKPARPSPWSEDIRFQPTGRSAAPSIHELGSQ
jgi:imidazolonepropionase-like amidohydrolase